MGIGNRNNSEAWILRNDIKDNYGFGIGARDTAAAVIERNDIHDNGRLGIGNFEESRTTISNGNRIYNNTKVGIGIHGNSQLLINGNKVFNNFGDAGIGAESGGSATISNNMIYSNYGVGVGFGDGSKPADRFSGTVEIIGNTIFANLGTGSNPGGIGGHTLDGATITITNNMIYSHADKSGIGFDAGSASLIIRDNVLDNSGVTSNGNYGIGISGNSGYTAAITGNDIRYFGLSGIRIRDFSVADSLSIQDNFISTCGTKDKVYDQGADMGDGNTCSDADGCPAASGIQLTNSTISSMTGNTIRYNLYAGIALRNTDAIMGPGNLIYENGNLTTVPGPLGGGDLCPTCESMGTGISTGDGGIAIRDLAVGEEVRIYDPGRTEIHDNQVGDIRIKPDNLGKVYVNDNRILPGSGGGDIPGFGVIYDCFDPEDATTSIAADGCNGVISNMVFSGKDRYGILVRGPYSQNLIFSGNDIFNNMPTTNSNNKICSGTVDEDFIGGGIALTCGARPVIKYNNIYNNGTGAPRPEGKGSRSGINMWQAGDAQIYGNNIYGNANDGIGLIDTPIVTSDPDYADIGTPDIGVIGQAPNNIYNNGRFGISNMADVGTANVNINNNNVYGNHDNGIGFLYFNGTAQIYSNNIYNHNSVVNPLPTGNTPNSMGIGIKYALGASFDIQGNILTSNSTALGIFGDFSGIYSCEVKFKDNEVGGIKTTGYFGVTSTGNTFIGSGLLIESNNEFGGFHHLGNAISLWIFTVGDISIVNNNIFSACKVGIRAIGGAQNVTVTDNIVNGGISLQNIDGTIDIRNNRINCYGGDCSATAGFSGAIKIINHYDDITISGNVVKSEGTVDHLINLMNLGLSAPDNLIIYSNTLEGAGSNGLRMTCLYGDATGHQIYSNTIYNNGSSDDLIDSHSNGIALLNVGNLTIYNNDIYSNENKGIALTEDTTTVCMYAEGTGSDIYGYVGPITIGSSGKPNNIHHNKQGGIALSNTPITTAPSIQYNNIYDNEKSGISVFNADNVAIQNNVIASNGMVGGSVEQGGIYNASGIRFRDSQLGDITGNTIRWNAFSGIAAYNSPGTISGNTIKYNGSGGQNCTDVLGSQGADGGVAVRYLALGDTLIVSSSNTISDNVLQSVSCNRDTEGNVIYKGQVLDCSMGYWSRSETIITVDPIGVYKNGVYLEPSENTRIYSGSQIIIDCDIPTIRNAEPNIISGGEVWGIAVVGGVTDVVIRNCIIENNQLDTNSYGPGGISMGGGLLIGPGVEAQVYNNDIRSNGAEFVTGSHVSIADEDGIDPPVTEWTTHPGNAYKPQWFAFSFGSNTTIGSMRVYTGDSNIYTWDIYFGSSSMWAPDFNYPDFEDYKIVDGLQVGRTPGTGQGWQVINAEQTLSQRRIWVNIYGGRVEDSVYEFQFKLDDTWVSSPSALLGATGSLKPGNTGVVMRCAEVDFRDNRIYSNKSSAVDIRGCNGIIKNNEIYNQLKNPENGLMRAMGINDTVDLTVESNYFHDNWHDLGFNTFSGDITITSNVFNNSNGYANTWNIGLQALIGDTVVSIRNNSLNETGSSRHHGIEIEATHDFHLDLTIRDNKMTDGRTCLKMRDLDDADILIVNNEFSGTARFGIQMQRMGAEGTDATVNIYSNTISDNERSGIRSQDDEYVTIKIEKNIMQGNAWNPNNLNTQDSIHFKGAIGSSFIISGNTITNSTAHPTVEWDAIAFKEMMGGTVTIKNNTITNHLLGAGIMFKECTGSSVIVSGNDIDYNMTKGIEFKDNILGNYSGYSVRIVNNNIRYGGEDGDGIMMLNNFDIDSVFIYSNEIYDNDAGVWLKGTENVVLEKNNIYENSNIEVRYKNCSPVIGPADYIFSFERPSCFSGKKYHMSEIFNTGMGYCDDTPCSCRGWYGAQFELDEPRGNYIQGGTSWGIQGQAWPNDAAAAADNDSAVTEWRTAAVADTHVDSHWIQFGLGSAAGQTITQIRVYARLEALSWEVYANGSTYVNTFTAGGSLTPKWYTNNIPDTVASTIKLESMGGVDGRIYRDLYELNFQTSAGGSTWYNLATYNATTNPNGVSGSASACSKEADDEKSGDGNMAVDSDYTTQWQTHPGCAEPYNPEADSADEYDHFVTFVIPGDTPVSNIRIRTAGNNTRTYKAYVGDTLITGVPVLATTTETVLDGLAVSGWVVGDDSIETWDESGTFTTKSGRYLRLEASDGPITDGQFLEVQYYRPGTGWLTPTSMRIACSWARDFSYKPVIKAGRVQGNDSTQIGQLGSNLETYIYGVYQGGGVESVSAQDDAIVWWVNSCSHGNNTVQAKEGAKVYAMNGTWINQKYMNQGGEVWIIDNNFFSYIGCTFSCFGGGNCGQTCRDNSGAGWIYVIDSNMSGGWPGIGAGLALFAEGNNVFPGINDCSNSIILVDGNWLMNGSSDNRSTCSNYTVIGFPNLNFVHTHSHYNCGCACYECYNGYY